jgi:hypothetical protein
MLLRPSSKSARTSASSSSAPCLSVMRVRRCVAPTHPASRTRRASWAWWVSPAAPSPPPSSRAWPFAVQAGRSLSACNTRTNSSVTMIVRERWMWCLTKRRQRRQRRRQRRASSPGAISESINRRAKRTGCTDQRPHLRDECRGWPVMGSSEPASTHGGAFAGGSTPASLFIAGAACTRFVDGTCLLRLRRLRACPTSRSG